MSAKDRKTPPEPSAAHAPRRAPRLPGWLRWPLKVLLGLLGLGVAAALGGVALVAMALALIYPNLPEISGLTDYRPKLPMRIYSSDEVLIGEFGEEKRKFMPIREIPEVMQNAVLAIEDARFYSHRGVDYIGIVRAGLANVGDSRSQGASTITMQVARNFYLPTEKTLSRKIYEILLAFKIESLLSKPQILEIYMNQIYLGQRAFGFGAAAEVYFGKPLKELTVAEAAMLAGLPKAPSAYNPIANPRRARQRQQHIIDRMYENGYVTEEQAQAAREQVLLYRKDSATPLHADYVAEAARQLVFSQYGEEAYTRGLNVHTSVNSTEQEAAYRALRRGVMDFERRQVYRGPEGYVDLPAEPKAAEVAAAEALDAHPDNDEIKAAVVLSADPKRVTVVLQNGDALELSGDGLKPAASGLSPKANPKVQVRRGAIIRVMKGARDAWTITQLPEVEGAMISLDPQTGAIRSMVGGFDHSKSKFNRALQAWRQPGSSFKPFIYSAALEQGFTPATVVNDAPLFFDAATTGSQPWEPKNYDGTFDGPMPLRRALAKSKNMVSIRVLQSIGTTYAQEWVTRFGFEAEKHPPFLPMALGTGSVTLMQMATGYAVFANGGYRVNPALVTRITDNRGRIVAQPQTAVLDESMRAIDERNAFLMSSLLQEVTRSGTAARAQATLKRPDLYGKTGTTNDSQDAWFAGYSASRVAVVWIGYDQPRKLGDRETGGGLALPVWIEYMAVALKGVPVVEPTAPPGVVGIRGDWFYEEFSPTSGVSSVGLNDPPATPAAPAASTAPSATEAERRSILDLFKQ